MSSVGPEALIRALKLSPHPEGGYFREIHRSSAPESTRAALTSIYFLLRRGERSHWHRIDATEVWHFHSGAPLKLSLYDQRSGPTSGLRSGPQSRLTASVGVQTHLLGPHIPLGERPQCVVPPNTWQAAETLGEFTLVGCTVAPAFEFSKFELAPAEWTPPSG